MESDPLPAFKNNTKNNKKIMEEWMAALLVMNLCFKISQSEFLKIFREPAHSKIKIFLHTLALIKAKALVTVNLLFLFSLNY